MYSLTRYFQMSSLRQISIWEVLLYSCIVFWVFVAVGDSNLPAAKQVLFDAGYSDIHVNKAGMECPQWWQMDRVEFEATASSGRSTRGWVCSGFGQEPQILIQD